MSATSGRLEPLKLFKVFRSILERRLGGTLTVRRGQVAKQARFAFGQILAAASNRPEESLARALVDEGLISSTERAEIDDARRADRRSFDAHVRERGLVAEARLESLQRRLSRACLLECFAWPDGQFEFAPAQVRANPKQVPIDSVEVLLEAAARHLPTPVCERFLARFAGQLVRPTEWMESYGAFFDTLFPAPNLRGMLQSALPATDLATLPGDKARNLREGAAMILAGLATLEWPAGARPATVSGPARVAPTPGQGTPSPEAEPPRRRAERSVPPRPASVAPHPTRSDPPQPRRAVARSTPEPSAADRPVRMRASAGPSAARAEAPARPARRASGASRRSAPAGGAPAKPIPDNIQAILDRARDLAGGLAERTHYEVLDVPESADDKAIRLAFRKLARDFHVDRFARYGLDKETLATVQRVFVAANKANEVLSSPEKRKEYDIGLEMKAGGAKVATGPGGGPQLDQMFKAEKLVKDATVLISRGQPEPAIERLKSALEVTPDDPVAKAALIFAENLVAQARGGSQVMLGRAKDALEQICADLDNREEPFLYLGRIYRTLDEPEKAIRAFERALKINPHYAEAGSELRHAQRKVEQNKSSGLAGLFGRRKK